MVFINIAVMLLGVVIEITAPNWKVFTVAEFIMPYTAGLLQSTAPLLVSELSPRGVRGIMMTAYPTIGEILGCHVFGR
jgi:predicted MFS family arabinose efflux permease